MAEQDVCPHLDSTGEVTKEDLLQKSKVGLIISLIVTKVKEDEFWTPDHHHQFCIWLQQLVLNVL